MKELSQLLKMFRVNKNTFEAQQFGAGFDFALPIKLNCLHSRPCSDMMQTMKFKDDFNYNTFLISLKVITAICSVITHTCHNSHHHYVCNSIANCSPYSLTLFSVIAMKNAHQRII